MVQDFELTLGKLGVSDIKGDGFSALGVEAHKFSKTPVLVFMRVDAFGGVQVEGCFQAQLVQLCDEALRIGK
jgi:hypothetical protein